MLSDRVAHAPCVDFPRLLALIRKLLEHICIWREIGHDRDVAVPPEEAGDEEELERPQCHEGIRWRDLRPTRHVEESWCYRAHGSEGAPLERLDVSSVRCSSFCKNAQGSKTCIINLDSVLTIDELLYYPVPIFLRASSLDIHSLAGICNGVDDRDLGDVSLGGKGWLQHTQHIENFHKADMVADYGRGGP